MGAEPKPETGERVLVLDGVRGIAVLMVMAYHFWLGGVNGTELGAGFPLYAWFIPLGATGVDLFFVLSGFLITSILFKTREMPHFYRAFFARRIVRIFPLYYLCLIIYFLILPLALRLFGRADLLTDPLFQAPALLMWTYTTNWIPFVPGATPIPVILQHFWSLAVEEQFYVTWPWIVKAFSRRKLMIISLCLIAVSFFLRQYFLSLGMGYVAYKWTFCVMDDLAIGAFAGLAYRDAADRRQILKAAPYAFVLALLCLVFLPQPYWSLLEITAFAVLFGSCIVMVLGLKETHPAARLLSSKPLHFLGKHSYAIYLFHQPIICVLALSGIDADSLHARLGSPLLAILALNALAFALSLVSGWLAWHIVEKHFLKLKSRPMFNPDPGHRESGTVKIA